MSMRADGIGWGGVECCSFSSLSVTSWYGMFVCLNDGTIRFSERQTSKPPSENRQSWHIN